MKSAQLDTEKVIAAYADFQGTLTEIRLALAGAVLDRALVEALGLRSVCKYDAADVLETRLVAQSSDAGEEVVLVRLWFSSKMHFREIRAYKQRTEGFRTRTEDLAGGLKQLCEQLRGCVLEPPVSSAEDEWSLMTEKCSLANDNPDYSEAMRQGLLLSGMIEGAFTRDKALVARAVMGVVRFPRYCPSAQILAEIANEAAKQGMLREAAALIREVFHRGELEAHVVNTLGCALHYMGRKDCALDLFLQALELEPKSTQYSNNVWLEVRDIFPATLREGRYEVLFALAERVVKSGFTGTEKDKAEVLCALGMAYEAGGDLEEAELYYQQAVKTFEECKPAAASLRRLNWRGADTRHAAFERLVQSFPELPEEKDTADAIPVEFTKGDVHGGHWATVTSDVEELIKQSLPIFIAEGGVRKVVRPALNSMSSSESIVAIIMEHEKTDHIRGVCLNTLDESEDEKRILLDSAYPAGVGGPVNELAVNRFIEWPGGVEGQIECVTRNGRSVTFFDPYYVYDRQQITKPCVCEFELFGFAQKIGLAEDREFEITDGPMQDFERKRQREENPDGPPPDVQSMTVHIDSEFTYLMQTEPYPDEGEFRGIVEKVEWFDYLGTEMCRLGMRFKASDDDEDFLTIDLFAGRHRLGEYRPNPGDLVQGVLWLQGFLHSDHVGVLCKRTRGCPDWARFIDLSGVSLWRGVTQATDFQLRALSAVCPCMTQKDLVVAVEPVLDAIPCDPEVALGLTDGRNLYVHIRGCASDEPEHDTQAQVWKKMRTAYAEQCGMLPHRFVEVSFEEMGKGYGLSYVGLDDLKAELGGTEDDQECYGGMNEVSWVRTTETD